MPRSYVVDLLGGNSISGFDDEGVEVLREALEQVKSYRGDR